MGKVMGNRAGFPSWFLSPIIPDCMFYVFMSHTLRFNLFRVALLQSLSCGVFHFVAGAASAVCCVEVPGICHIGACEILIKKGQS